MNMDVSQYKVHATSITPASQPPRVCSRRIPPRSTIHTNHHALDHPSIHPLQRSPVHDSLNQQQANTHHQPSHPDPEPPSPPVSRQASVMTPWHIQDMPITQHSSLLPRDHPLRSELSLPPPPPTSYARTTRIPVMRMEHAEEAISSAQLSFCGRASAATVLPFRPPCGSHWISTNSASASLLRYAACAFGLCRASPQAEPLTICFHSGPLWARPPAVMSYLHCTRVAPTFDWGSGMSSCFKGLLSPWSQSHVLGTSTSTSHLQLAGFSPLSWAVSGRPSRPNHRKMLQLVCDGHDLQHLWHPAALQNDQPLPRHVRATSLRHSTIMDIG